MDKIVEIKKLSCKMGKRYLVKDIDWVVRQGEQWIIFGMNGSGKTTLLSIIAGYKYNTEGIVKICGESYNRSNVLEIRKKIGFVSSAFFDKHYSRENVLDIILSGKTGCLGINENLTLEDAVFAKKLLKYLKIGDKIKYQFDMLSKGERQNVLIARALINKPRLLILDEPASGLDVYSREFLYKTLEVLKDIVSIIYVTHQPDEIIPIYNKCLLLKNGTVFAQGDMNDIFTSKNISQLLECEAKVGVDKKNRKTIDLSIDTPQILELLFSR